ncbi:NF-X1-type zinc finger protein NFXL1 [Schistocerca nitens]|uniref:NF-X1-type zinc finger protein NFXL1 n=1 Tax=Schistocerca nitens TaxID=7011 RepID=UPI002117C1CC|nr:NF-X1-type zinc finger protein NFXL1 [Schistocerca nitens]
MESRRGGRGNPWNRGGGRGSNARGRKTENKNQNTRSVPLQMPTAEERFKEAQLKQQASLQKHLSTGYESSSEEDDLENDNILESVLKSYSQLGGRSDELGRTQRFLEEVFQSGAATCLICIASVKRNDAIWSCIKCYCFFHLICIQRWAKDSIMHQKQAEEDTRLLKYEFTCPKCRHEYEEKAIPQKYYCFCGRTLDPPFHPWLLPHSCGETCGRPLEPLCGHDCLLLCHPGPCPPCPKMVRSTCYCGKQPPRPQRCCKKEWSCGSVCGRKLSCGRHECPEQCHPGDCSPCPRTSKQHCVCGAASQIRQCADPVWHCDKVCGKNLSCGYHSCEQVCHAGPCGDCPLSGPRTCPCGKASFVLPCTEETPVCGDTCGRPLECGVHRCPRRCHRDKCGSCLEVITKSCRCGLHTKEQPCKKEFLCDTKCKRVKDCFRHPCNRKCCDGNCPPCEKPCGRTLTCGNHKCASICHRGQCYPCPLTAEVKCRCGSTTITVPCGRKKHTKPPRCFKLCRLESLCHHPVQSPHKCHFGDCPPCKQKCERQHKACGHLCPAPCHSAVLVKIETDKKPAGPWEKVEPRFELRDLSCPDCVVPMPVTCLGGHETSDWPCYLAKPSSCQRPCGRHLACGNHTCTLPCHEVVGAKSETEAGETCEVCEAGCSKPRPEGCSHICPKPCHPGSCAPCPQMIRLRCHCALNQLFVRCSEWINASEDSRSILQSCKNRCPKNFACGHRCQADCHPGDCPDSSLCRKKVKISCPCRRIKRDFACDLVRNGQAKVECDEVCLKKKEEEAKARELEELQKQKEEDRKNQEELERFQKKFQGRKKHRDRRQQEGGDQSQSLLSRYWFIALCGIVGVIVSFYFVTQV